MTVQVVKNFIEHKYATGIVSNFGDVLSEVKDRPGFFEDFNELRIPRPMSEYDHDKYQELYPFLKEEHHLYGAAQISDVMFLSKVAVEEFYGVTLNGYEGGMVRLVAGAKNGLHSDMYNLDGTNWQDGSGRQDELEYSALLYLSDYGKDFEGGKIIFPKQDLVIEPEAGMLVFFRGDLDHVHEVEEVLSGNRYAIIMFFGESQIDRSK